MSSKNNTYAVILAGGAGTRFWPMSRENMPKQFLNMTSAGTLFEETISRISSKISPKRMYIVSNKKYYNQIKKITSKFKIPNANILLEPAVRNTGPAICWAAQTIYSKDQNATLVVLPSDHLILNRSKFLKVINQGCRLAQDGHLVTLGIKPTRPETGYGYLNTRKTKINGKIVCKVKKFVEKPNLKNAQAYIQKRNFYWNSGMFIWKASVILDEFRQKTPKIYRSLSKNFSQTAANRVWKKLPSISIDYGILEKAKKVAAVPAVDIQWSDLGSWQALCENLGKDKKGNILRGDVAAVDVGDSLIWSTGNFTAVIGLKDIVVINTRDALLVCPKDKSQYVRDIVSLLKKHKRKEV